MGKETIVSICALWAHFKTLVYRILQADAASLFFVQEFDTFNFLLMQVEKVIPCFICTVNIDLAQVVFCVLESKYE